MFQFSVNNLHAFLIAFIPGLISLGLVVYIMIALPRNRLVNVFTIFTLCTGIWQINDAIGRVSTSGMMTDFWDCIFSAGWILVAPLCLHFSLLYARVIREQVSLSFISLLYLPAFIFMGLYQTHIYAHNFRFDNFWGWVNYHDEHPLDLLMIYWMASLVLIACCILFYYTFKIRKEKLFFNQAALISFGIAIPTVAGIITQLILPTILEKPSIPVTSSFMCFISITTVIALRRYRLFTISELATNEVLLGELPVAVLSISDTGHITYLNKCAATTFNLPKESPMKFKLNDVLQFSSMEDETNFRQAYTRALNGEDVNTIETSLNAGDKTFHMLISANPIVNNKKVLGALFCLRDVSALKASEFSLQQKNIELEHKNANLEEFAFITSHDLREPLRKIITFGGMVINEEKEKLGEKSREYMQRMMNTADRMQVMIEDLLSLSLISANGEFEHYSLNAILDEVQQDLDNIISESKAVIDVAPLPSAFINPPQFRQLFANLISNALKFSRAGIQPVITIKSSVVHSFEAEKIFSVKNGNYLKITVADNGIGLENAYAEKIFQMFQRLHARTDYEGTGIGLAICKKIVENHKGIIYAFGELGKGTTITVIIPDGEGNGTHHSSFSKAGSA